VFGGFLITFVPQFFLGNAGMPRRYYSYPSEFQWLNVVSTVGAFIIGVGLILTLVNLVVAVRYGARAGSNPWGSRSFEWSTSSPPPTENFTTPPVITRGPYDYDLNAEEADARVGAG
jgi:cytochrome c oxidase subunit 1